MNDRFFYFACSEVFLIISLVLEQYCFCCKTFPSHAGKILQLQVTIIMISNRKKEQHLENYSNKVVSRRGYALTCKSSCHDLCIALLLKSQSRLRRKWVWNFHFLVAKFSPSLWVNFWVRWASGNVFSYAGISTLTIAWQLLVTELSTSHKSKSRVVQITS